MVLDIIVVSLALISGIIGIKKGMITIVTKLVGFILAIVLAFSFYKSFATYLTQNYEFPAKITESIKNAIVSGDQKTSEDGMENIDNAEHVDNENIAEGDKVENLDDTEKAQQEYISISNILQKFNLTGKINLEKEQENLDDKKTLSDVVAEKITVYIMNIISFLIIFLGIIIVAAVLSLVLGIIFSLPLLNSVNRMGGFAAEVVLFMVKLWVVLGIISILSPMSFMNWIVGLIDSSTVMKFLYNHNVLMQLIYKIKI